MYLSRVLALYLIAVPLPLGASEQPTEEDVINALEQAYIANYSNLPTLHLTIFATARDPAIKKKTVTRSDIKPGLQLEITQHPEYVRTTKVIIDGANERYDNTMPDWTTTLVVRDGLCTSYCPDDKFAHVFANTPDNAAQWPFADIRNLGFLMSADRLLTLLDSGRVQVAEFGRSPHGDQTARVEVRTENDVTVGIECSAEVSMLPNRIYYKNSRGLYEYFADISYARYEKPSGSFLLPAVCECYYSRPRPMEDLHKSNWSGAAKTTIEIKDVVIGAPVPSSVFDIPQFVEGTAVTDLTKGTHAVVGKTIGGIDRGSFWRWGLVVVNTVVVLALGAIVSWRYLRRLRSAES